MKFFKMTDGVLTLNKDEIALHPNIKKILSRDRGGKIPGDPDGRLKYYAYREFAYVYFKCDFEAFPAQNGLSDIEAHKYAVREARLEDTYQPDDQVKALMIQYEKEHLSPTKRAIKTLIRVFALNEKVVEKIEQNLTATMDLPTLTRDQINEVLTYQKQLIDIATNVPAQVKKLREAMSLLEEEEKVIQVIRGGEEKPESMDPDNTIEN